VTSPGDGKDGKLSDAAKSRGALAELYPLPTWHVIPPGDVFRVFERGGRTIGTQFAEIGLPSPSGSIQRLEEGGRPDIRQSNRGPATGLRVAIPSSTSTRPASTIPSCGSWGRTTSRATIANRAAPAATSSMPTTASLGTA
jgi:hypothetical protein